MPRFSNFIILLLVLVTTSASAVDLTVLSIGPAVGQESHPAGAETRYVGTRTSLLVTFSSLVTSTPDLTKIDVFLRGTSTSAIGASEIIEPVAGNQQQWKYSFQTFADGQVDVVFGAGAATTPIGTSLTAFTYQMTADTIPLVGITEATNGATLLRFTTSNLGGFEPPPAEPVPVANDSFASALNGSVSAGATSGSSVAYDVTPFGYGTITFTVKPGFVVDKWTNTNITSTSVGTFNAPSGTPGQAPHIVSINGVSPDNLVYHTGDTIDFDVVFDRAVVLKFSSPATLNSLPTLLMNCTGSGPLAVATPLTVTGSTIHYQFVVQAGNRNPFLDVASTAAMIPVDQTALVGANIVPDFIASYTLPSPGATHSLSANALYSINVEAAKPNPNDIAGASEPDKCAVGSGTGLLLSLAGLSLFGLRRRR